ncbi:MAG: D-alanyl-D-alanine carboxypeptidase family protein [Myxococcales bacterium]|nr:D-alanyl-D-alanine carboxypeptidase family protein [Myxococcales bacterium]
MRITAALLLSATALACTEPPSLGERGAAATVSDFETTSCSTAVVLELSRQIAGEVGCMVPGQLVAFPEGNGLVFTGGAILPYASEVGRADLLAAVAAGGGAELQLTSAYRTVAQQYLLYRWYQLGRCGIPVAAAPGGSNHESGRAIDVGNFAAWITILGDHGWAHDVPGDDVHFDHLASPDLRGTDVLAFQRLWNRNRPATPIDEDGDYGPMTAMALAMAPAEGFALGPSCATEALAVEVLSIAGARTVASGATFTVEVTVRNAGTVTWPADTALVTAEPLGRASDLTAPSWLGPDRIALAEAATPPGATRQFTFDAIAPVVESDTELTEAFTLAIGADHAGALALVVTVTADGGGCCSTGGRGDGWVLPALAGALGLRRRRRR